MGLVGVEAALATEIPEFYLGVLGAGGEKPPVGVEIRGTTGGPVAVERARDPGYLEVPELESDGEDDGRRQG